MTDKKRMIEPGHSCISLRRQWFILIAAIRKLPDAGSYPHLSAYRHDINKEKRTKKEILQQLGFYLKLSYKSNGHLSPFSGFGDYFINLWWCVIFL
jgi:hypothetical protein